MLCAQCCCFIFICSQIALLAGEELSCPVALPAFLPPDPLQQELPTEQPSLHCLKAGSSDLMLLMQGCSLEISGALQLLQSCGPPGASLGSGVQRAWLWEGERKERVSPSSMVPAAFLSCHLCCQGLPALRESRWPLGSWHCLGLELCMSSLPAQMG